MASNRSPQLAKFVAKADPNFSDRRAKETARNTKLKLGTIDFVVSKSTIDGYTENVSNSGTTKFLGGYLFEVAIYRLGESYRSGHEFGIQLKLLARRPSGLDTHCKKSPPAVIHVRATCEAQQPFQRTMIHGKYSTLDDRGKIVHFSMCSTQQEWDALASDETLKIEFDICDLFDE